MKVAAMQWLLVVAGFELTVRSESTVDELVLNLSPTQEGTDLDGAVFKCVAVDTGGIRYEAIITLSVEGMQILRGMTVVRFMLVRS